MIRTGAMFDGWRPHKGLARQGGRSEPSEWLFLETGLWERMLWRSRKGLSFPVSWWHLPDWPSHAGNGNRTPDSEARLQSSLLSWACGPPRAGDAGFGNLDSESMRCWGVHHIQNKRAFSHHYGHRWSHIPRGLFLRIQHNNRNALHRQHRPL